MMKKDNTIIKEEKRYGAYPTTNAIVKGQTYTEMIFAEMLKNQARREIAEERKKLR